MLRIDKMIYLKTAEEIELLRESNLLVSKTLAELAKLVKPGVTTAQLDKIAEEFIRDNGAIPAFKGYGGFPASICTSVNDQVVHGIPSDKVILKDGDIVSIDCGTFKNGFVGDSAYTFCVGEVSAEIKKLLETTKNSLFKGIEQAVEGNRIGDIGYAVQITAKLKDTVWYVKWWVMVWVVRCTNLQRFLTMVAVDQVHY